MPLNVYLIVFVVCLPRGDWVLITSVRWTSHDIPSGERQTQLDQVVGLRIASGGAGEGPVGLQAPLHSGARQTEQPDQSPGRDLE